MIIYSPKLNVDKDGPRNSKAYCVSDCMTCNIIKNYLPPPALPFQVPLSMIIIILIMSSLDMFTNTLCSSTDQISIGICPMNYMNNWWPIVVGQSLHCGSEVLSCALNMQNRIQYHRSIDSAEISVSAHRPSPNHHLQHCAIPGHAERHAGQDGTGDSAELFKFRG